MPLPHKGTEGEGGAGGGGEGAGARIGGKEGRITPVDLAHKGSQAKLRLDINA